MSTENSSLRKVGIGAGIGVGVATGVLSVGYSALKGVAWLDRRRFGIHGDWEAQAKADLAEPSNAAHRKIPTFDGGEMHFVVREPRINPEARSIDGEGGVRASRGFTTSQESEPTTFVLLHGVTLGAAVWNHQLTGLPDEFRILAPDWRGHGSSKAGRDGYGLEPLARDLITLLETERVTNAVVVGHSMGGMALMHALVRYPEMVRTHIAGAVFCSTAAGRVASGPLRAPVKIGAAFAKRRPELAGRAAAEVPGDLGYAAVRLGFGRSPSPLAVEQCRQFLAHMSPAALSASMLSLLDHDLRDPLADLTVPSLILVGSKDIVTPPSQAEEIHSSIFGSELMVFEGAGHLLMLERQAELTSALTEFARRVEKRKGTC